MSLLINQTYSNPDTPLWLGQDFVKSNVNDLVIGSPGSPIVGGYLTVGSYTFPTAVNSVTLQGWLVISNSGGSGTGTICLSESTSTFDFSKTTSLTTITITGGGQTYIQLDNLQYFSATPFTTIYLLLQNSGGSSVGTLTSSSATGTATYGSALPLSWSLAAGGSIVVMGG